MRLASPASRDRIRFRIEAADLLSAIAAPLVALALRDPVLLDPGALPWDFPAPYQYAFISTACALLMMLCFRLSDRMGQFFSVRDAFAVCGAAAGAVVSSCVILFALTRFEGVPRSTPLIYGLVLSASMIAIRVATRLRHKDLERKHGPDSRTCEDDLQRVIVVGVDRLASAAIKLTDYLLPAKRRSSPRSMGGRVSSVGRSQASRSSAILATSAPSSMNMRSMASMSIRFGSPKTGRFWPPSSSLRSVRNARRAAWRSSAYRKP